MSCTESGTHQIASEYKSGNSLATIMQLPDTNHKEGPVKIHKGDIIQFRYYLCKLLVTLKKEL